MKVSCWCYHTKRQVTLEGQITGKRQADLLQVTSCEHQDTCPKRRDEECLIGKLREGKWP